MLSASWCNLIGFIQLGGIIKGILKQDPSVCFSLYNGNTVVDGVMTACEAVKSLLLCYYYVLLLSFDLLIPIKFYPGISVNIMKYLTSSAIIQNGIVIHMLTVLRYL